MRVLLSAVSFSFLLALAIIGCSSSPVGEPKLPATSVAPTDAKALTLPPELRVESSRPRVGIWKKLTPKEKKLAFHLLQITREGRALIFSQSHRHSLAMRDFFIESLNSKNIAKTKKLLADNFPEYLVYAGRFLDASGPYGRGGLKYIVQKVSAEQVATLLESYAKALDPKTRVEIVKLMTDPKFEVALAPIGEGDKLEDTGGNLYEKGITREAVAAAQKKGLAIDLNCRIVKKGESVDCDHQTVNSPGLIGEKLTKIRNHLKNALPYTANAEQKKQFEDFITYLETGDEKLFRSSSIAWVKSGTDSTIDFVIGWVETYEDYLASIGSWETMLLVVDPEVTKISKALAKHAQYFENEMPYDYEIEGKKVAFKKKFPADYSPPAIMGYYFDEINTMRTLGFNLPNFEDIRRDIGFKNVIKLPLPGSEDSPEAKQLKRLEVEAFAPADKVDDIMAHFKTMDRVEVLLHEIIGHGSGTYDPAKFGPNETPSSALGSLGQSLEEQRADLTGLVFGNDPKLVQAGVIKDEATRAKLRDLMWDNYIAMHFSAAFSKSKSLTQAHRRGRLLLISKLLDVGAITWAAKDGKSPMTLENQVLRVKDYDLCRKTSRELLSELQRIKATKDLPALKALYEKYAPTTAINEPWAQALLKRGETLKSFYGFVEQPWDITPDGKTIRLYGKTTLESVTPFWGSFYR